MKLSLVIPVRDINDPKLKELLRSIESQDFDKSQMETLIITEGTSESAKAIGIRKAKGEVIGILASDNELPDIYTLKVLVPMAKEHGACYSRHYHLRKSDNILNRYFSLIGGNDPLCFYMGKNDRVPIFQKERIIPYGRSIGDNGFFVRRELILNTDLDNYYHIDNSNEIKGYIEATFFHETWHKTGGNIFSFFAKRYRYGLQHAFNKNRRWHLVDFRQPRDIWRLAWFILCSVTVMEPLFLSIRGYLKVKDKAWFMHPIVALGTVFTYGLLVLHLLVRMLFQLLSAPTVAQKA